MKHIAKAKNNKRRQGSSVMPQAVECVLAVLVMLISATAAGLGFIIIAGSSVARVLVVLCTCVLVILPAFVTKTFAVLTGFRNRRTLCLLSAAGFLISLYPLLCFFVSHDYEMSVYRYMKTSQADVYYFGGLDEIKKDYDSTEDYMYHMKQAPASIVLQSMSRDKLHELSSEDLGTIINESLWDYCGFDEILGATADEVHDSMEQAAGMNAYDFTFDYRGLSPKDLKYMLKNPKAMFQELSLLFMGGNHSDSPAVLVFYFVGQLFALYMISLHFDVNEKGQLVYLYEKHERSFVGDSIAFIKSAYGREGRKHPDKRTKDRIPAAEPPDVSPAEAAHGQADDKAKK